MRLFIIALTILSMCFYGCKNTQNPLMNTRQPRSMQLITTTMNTKITTMNTKVTTMKKRNMRTAKDIVMRLSSQKHRQPKQI